MRKSILFLLIVLSGFQLMAQDDFLYHQIHAQLLVKDQAEATQSLSEWTESVGGYFTIQSLDRLLLRVPHEHLEDLKSKIDAESEEIINYSQNAMDLRENYLMTSSSLESRKEVLARNMEYLSSSDTEGTLTLEQEIRRLMQEIDSFQGYLRKMDNDRQFAQVDLYISFKNQSLPDISPSRFSWVNSVDFHDFINSNIPMKDRGFFGVSLPLPEGFALAVKKPWYHALSPEGVKLRLRQVKNYPEQDAPFWSKTLFSYMSHRGYITVNDEVEKLSLDEGEDFLVRRWGISYGRKDYIYLTGLRIRKGKIEILEIAGEALYLNSYFPEG